MSTLVDTNLLVRSLQPSSPHYPAAAAAIFELNRRDEPLIVVPQVLYEFWSVCTRPAGENGLGLSSADAQVEQAKALDLFTLLHDSPATFGEWQRLVVRHDVRGKGAHDARLVAAMTVHGIANLLTFNGSDFRRYPGISVIDPTSLVLAPPPGSS